MLVVWTKLLEAYLHREEICELAKLRSEGGREGGREGQC